MPAYGFNARNSNPPLQERSLRPHDDIAAVDGRLLDELTTIVSAAAAAILAARAGSLEVRAKADLSPVTAADHAAEALILRTCPPAPRRVRGVGGGGGVRAPRPHSRQ